jgi:hypothetical protein
MRRPLVSEHLGFSVSLADEETSGAKTIAAAGYWRPKGSYYFGVRLGDQSGRNGQGQPGGFFATVFVGSSFAFRP